MGHGIACCHTRETILINRRSSAQSRPLADSFMTNTTNQHIQLDCRELRRLGISGYSLMDSDKLQQMLGIRMIGTDLLLYNGPVTFEVTDVNKWVFARLKYGI